MSEPVAASSSLALPFLTIEDLTHALDAAHIGKDELIPDEKGTLCAPVSLRTTPKKTTSPSSPSSPSLEALAEKAAPLAIIAGASVDGAEIVWKGALSRGGMGEVMVAEQVSVGREVAVKRVSKATERRKGRSTIDPSIAAADLVAEGRVAGQLTHPNIVPVHLLGLTDEGDPIIVMKRVDGESWREQLKRGRNLRRDIDVLMHVCRALHFAHARGVIHRDVKPSNVMLGRHGEIYLLDWGIAVGFGENAPPELPRADDAGGVVGTALYMAPEMVLGKTGVDVRTDVYLVGAVLYELISGRAPHAAESIERSLLLAQSSPEPMFFTDVPDELASICKRAMRRDPAERFANVEELRLALDAFQRHAVARDLCAGADERLEELSALAEREASAAPSLPSSLAPSSSSTTGARASEDALQRAFTECRFGFEQALAIWPESPRAKRGLVDALTLMADREIARGRHDAAALLVGELRDRGSVPAELAARLAALAKQRDDDAAGVRELQRFARDEDRKVARPERALLLFGAGIAWLATMVALTVLEDKGVFAAGPGSFSLSLGSISVGFGAGALLLPRLIATTGSRAMFTLMLTCTSALSLLHGAAWWFHVDKAPALAVGHTCMAFTVVAMAAHDSRITIGAIIAIPIVPAIFLFPDAAILVSGIGAFLALSAVAIATARGTPSSTSA